MKWMRPRVYIASTRVREAMFASLRLSNHCTVTNTEGDQNESVFVAAKREADELRASDVLLALLFDPSDTMLNAQIGYALVAGKRVVVVCDAGGGNNLLLGRPGVERVASVDEAMKLFY